MATWDPPRAEGQAGEERMFSLVRTVLLHKCKAKGPTRKSRGGLGAVRGGRRSGGLSPGVRPAARSPTPLVHGGHTWFCIFLRPREQCLSTFPFKNLSLLWPKLYLHLLQHELRVINKKLRLRLFLTGIFFS